MGDYKIRINIESEELSKIIGENSIDVTLESLIPEEKADNIDAIVKAFDNLGKEAVRQAISAHLEGLSKKKLKISKKNLEEQLKQVVMDTVWKQKLDE